MEIAVAERSILINTEAQLGATMPIAIEPLKILLRQKRERSWERRHLACWSVTTNVEVDKISALPAPPSLLTK
jgi:hypothetical protein